MPIPKSKQDLYGKVLGFNLNKGVPRTVAKHRAERAVEEALGKTLKKKSPKKKKASRKKK